MTQLDELKSLLGKLNIEFTENFNDWDDEIELLVFNYLGNHIEFKFTSEGKFLR